jgi:hypothetical protein
VAARKPRRVDLLVMAVNLEYHGDETTKAQSHEENSNFKVALLRAFVSWWFYS